MLARSARLDAFGREHAPIEVSFRLKHPFSLAMSPLSRTLCIARTIGFASIVLAAISSASISRCTIDPAFDDHVKAFPDHGLTLTLPAQLTEITDAKWEGDQIKGGWRAKLGSASVTIWLYILPDAEFGFSEPEDVSDIALANMRKPDGIDPSFGYEKTLLVSGPFGFAPYAAIGYGPVHKKNSTEFTGTMFVMGGLLKDHGYSLEVHTTPALSDEDIKVVLEFFKKDVAYKGDVRVYKWTDAEAKARWMHDAPTSAQKKLEPIVRTEHYIVLSDSQSAKDFGKKMEECYAAIRKMYPFEEVPGRKLMPVFLFRTQDEYVEFFANIAKITKEGAARSKGHAWRDYYATYFEATNDPVHIHEGTHQIFSNRLRLQGGGSWFQEGVAEFMSTKPNDRNVTARLVKTGKHMPLAKFVTVESLLDTSKKDDVKGRDDDADNQYQQAAFFIEFLHESKWSKDKFQNVVHAIGNSAPNNTQSIDRAFQSALGKDIAGVEAQWVEYAKNRR